MTKHVVVGSGQVGALLAAKLIDKGEDVTVITRSGSGPANARRVAVDVADRGRLIEAAKGADVLYNCVSPKYHRWPIDWPPLAASILGTAEATGAVLVTLSNLYPYGQVSGPMVEDLPFTSTTPKARVRAEMWEQALAAHRAGRIRTTEVRASDFFGPGSSDQSYLGSRFIAPLKAGKSIPLAWPPDVPHSWTYIPDVVNALIIAGSDDRAWGRPWHIPTNEPLTFRELAERMAALLNKPMPGVRQTPWPLLRAVGLFSPLLGELRHVRYQFVSPFIVDSSAFQATFGLAPTPVDQALRATLDI
ncbi:NAD-dependent epimerase/dehydratase family protein [Sinosporangium siamense]|uniref:NAD-dependent epimerase n=1 Tax=Sinosporangium siamense TaxID=1367973 RepID=A0A919RMF6_9ACTN|nr:NAD-dependent epimerase/dehydratase family protein [Sinosporangium siamense]GII96475.1 NAD-dependent epimerase [Sinosporangium siamense]